MSTTCAARERSRANLGALISAAAAEVELTTRQAAEAAEQASESAYQRGFDAGYDLGADAVRDQVLAILDGIAGSPGLSPCLLDALRLAVRSAGVKG
jgi:flagellar biosynthesis/type III secretory pathway protein FliH